MIDVLLVDDEKLIVWGLKRDLERVGYRVTSFEGADEALASLETQRFTIALIDVRMPGIGGIALLERIKQVDPETQVIMITAFADVETAVNSIRKGAFDFILKPFSLEKIHLTIQNALEATRLKKEVASLKTERALRQKKHSLLGASEAMTRVAEAVERVGKAGAGVVLLCGESGVGKGVVATHLHKIGPRSGNPFIEINCGAIPETLFESELFGHEKGAFTGAVELKKGLLELADGGTIFLDEVGEIPLPAQTKLLKALEEQTIWRVGGRRSIKVDVNIVAATNRDLLQAVREGRFREDLFYRLNVVPIFIPPLRARDQDILTLADYFLDHFQKKYQRFFTGFAESTARRMLAYSWPGNVRELRNCVERAVILEPGEVLSEASLGLGENPVAVATVAQTVIAGEINIPEQGVDLISHLEAIEQKYLQKALMTCGGNQSQAAKILGMSRDILRYRLKKYGLLEI